MEAVVDRTGLPNDQQEAQEIADIINNVERRLRGR
jgi:hypothetical protein